MTGPFFAVTTVGGWCAAVCFPIPKKMRRRNNVVELARVVTGVNPEFPVTLQNDK
jgi:hypothetical protein